MSTTPYTMPDAHRWHPATFELVHRHYFWLVDSYPSCTPIHQIYNTIKAFAPDLNAAITSIREATTRLIADMRRYPEDAWKMAQALPYLEEFAELVQETSARLHNGEPAKKANIDALNASFAESEQRAAERQQQWLAQVAAGDAYFGGPGAYACIREEMYAETDLKKHESLRQRIQAFEDAYHRGEQPTQQELPPVQAGLWEAA